MRVWYCLFAATLLCAQAPDPAYNDLSRAFQALKTKDYDSAITAFRLGAKASPQRTDIHKNLAYTLLKTGDTDAAREEFGIAVKLDPADLHTALEYAFLLYEAKEEASSRKAEARRIFLRISEAGDPESRKTAAQAFQNVDAPLASGIARWKTVLATSKPTFSAHFELAQLAEMREEYALAAANYLAAYQLLSERKTVLLDLARVELARSNPEGANAALLAASRGGEMRAAELAKERLPERYPYVYEFRNALVIDPKNAELHRELAYLLLSMSEKGQTPSETARKEFEEILDQTPDDYLAAAQLGLLYFQDKDTARATPLFDLVLKKAPPAVANKVRMALNQPTVLEERTAADANAVDPRILAARSYDNGFLKDARHYYRQAREANPVDAEIALKLGWTNNMLHDDSEALRWFGIARKSADPLVSGEAEKAYRSLLPGVERIRTTAWIYPLFSSRWKDLFGYGQVKSEIKLGDLPFRPYASVRFVGDTRLRTGGALDQTLSESAFIVSAGVSSRYWHGAMGWFEVGSALGYLYGTADLDVRGGVAWSRSRGASILSEKTGFFHEANVDSVYVSRFNHDWLNVVQYKTGWTAPPAPLRAQLFWNWNATVDAKHQYWANFIETGPSLRVRPANAPPSLSVTFSMIRGVFLTNHDNPRRPNFWDFRMGVWYAFTK